MTKTLVSALLYAFLATAAFSEDSHKNFIVTIDGQEFEINPGDVVTGKSKSGADIKVELKRKEFSTFEQGDLSFEYRSDLSVASSDIASDIHQHLVASAVGTLMIVQQYDKINPGGLAEFMLKQFTDGSGEPLEKMDKTEFSRTLSDGTILKGLKASAPEKDGTSFEVLAADQGVGGVVAVTRISNDADKTEQPIIDRFWQTLRLKK
jgi:hypothetical protein